MQNHIWAKTLLSSYRFLERIAGAIDKIIEKKALSSSQVSLSNIVTNNTLVLADQIIDLSERKIKLINLKILIQNALGKMDKSQARILIKKYIEKNSVDQILDSMSLSRRTYFRKVSEAESAFEAVCASLGYPYNKLDVYLQSEKWILEIKNSYEKNLDSSIKLKVC